MAATLTDPLLGTLVDGRYEVLSRIARGGMATVYLAIDRRLDREVALKVMHPHLAEGTTGTEFVAQFRREARAVARLTHPGLVGVLDQGVDGETSYLAMEYVDGTDLRHRMSEGGPLTVKDALRTVESVLEALAVAHRTGLVHRDIKPENVLISTDNRVKVADFGLARAVTEVTSTTTGMMLGTVAYLAPELVARGVSDPRTDVYAVGILLYEMLTGRQPFTGATPIQIAYQHVNCDVPALSAVVDWMPTEIDELVTALTAREPSDRPTDATAALHLVRRIHTSLDTAVLERHAKAPVIATAPDDSADDGVEHDLSATAPVAPPLPPDHMRRTMALPIGAGLPPAPVPRGGTKQTPPAPDTPASTPPSPPSSQTPPPRLRPAPPPPLPPRTRRRGLRVAIVLVIVATLTTVGWWFMTFGPGAFRPVPPGLVGVEQSAAEAILATAGLDATVTETFDPQVPAGTVVSTTPSEGDSVRKDGSVDLVLSKGPDMRVVPDGLVGAPMSDVVAALENAGFVLAESASRSYDDAVPRDSVISMSDNSGAQLPVGSVITLTVSDGPAPLNVVSVVGLEQQDAIGKLEAQGLVVNNIAEGYSRDYPAGVVIAQTPASGEGAHRTDSVTIIVSLGPPLVAVPNVVNQTADDATATLEAAGFAVTTNRTWPWDQMVVEQAPVAGSMVSEGSTVTIYLR